MKIMIIFKLNSRIYSRWNFT